MRTSIDGLAGSAGAAGVADSPHDSAAHSAGPVARASTRQNDASGGMDVIYMSNPLFDHVSVRWNGNVPQGFNPEGTVPFGSSRMHNERGHIDGVKHFNTTRAQNEAGKAYMHRYVQNHPEYSIFGSNCVDNVEGVMRAEGIQNVPSAKEHLSPLNYFNAVPAAASATPSPDLWRSAKSRLGK